MYDYYFTSSLIILANLLPQILKLIKYRTFFISHYMLKRKENFRYYFLKVFMHLNAQSHVYLTVYNNPIDITKHNYMDLQSMLSKKVV